MASLLAPELRTQLLDPFRTAVANLGESMLARLLLAARNRERDLRGLPPMLEQDMYPCDFMARPFLATTVVGFEYPFPVPPLLHFVGPTAPAHYPELTGELRAWFNEQWRPVVFVAFGTMHVFKEKECNSLLGALERLSASGEAAVLWSLTEAQQALLKDSARASPRLRIETYVPQYAILSHPKTQVFVSHCGANSVAEALLTETPVVACPVMADQPANAGRLLSCGCGVRVPGGAGGRVDVAVREVLADKEGFQSRLAHMRRLIAVHGGAPRAADVLEQLATVGHAHLDGGVRRAPWGGRLALIVAAGVLTAFGFACRSAS